MKISHLILSSIIFIICSYCSNEKSEVLSPEELENQYFDFVNNITSDSSSAKITLQRTQCFGSCPVYAIAIFEDGKVQYYGKMNVEKIGLHLSTISLDELNSLVTFAKLKDYPSLNDSYTTKADTAEDGTIYQISVSDLPTQITSLKIDGIRKIVRNYFGGPSWLTEFENKIDLSVNVKKWVGRKTGS
jgi:hypothetical protein